MICFRRLWTWEVLMVLHMLSKRRTDGRILEHITGIRLKNSGDLLVNLEIPLSQVGTETCLIILSPCMGLLPVAFISHEITPSSPPEEKI